MTAALAVEGGVERVRAENSLKNFGYTEGVCFFMSQVTHAVEMLLGRSRGGRLKPEWAVKAAEQGCKETGRVGGAQAQNTADHAGRRGGWAWVDGGQQASCQEAESLSFHRGGRERVICQGGERRSWVAAGKSFKQLSKQE